MASRVPKRVSRDVMNRIVDAISEIGQDSNAPRTKREIQRRTGLSHDAVARAFRQDADVSDEHKLNERFNQVGTGPARLLTADQQVIAELRERLSERNRELRVLRAEFDAAASAVLALSIQVGHIADDRVVPLRGSKANSEIV